MGQQDSECIRNLDSLQDEGRDERRNNTNVALFHEDGNGEKLTVWLFGCRFFRGLRRVFHGL